jgi:hypothetical protein
MASSLEAMPTYAMTIRRTKKKTSIKVQCVPPEEFLISRDATCEDDAEYIGHRRINIRVSDLVSLGYDYDEILAAAGPGDDSDNTEANQRNPELRDDNRLSSDPSMRKVKYCEGLIRIDLDGDGIAELTRVCTVGDNHRIVQIERASDINFAIFSPSPEPHTAIGRSIADETMDLQRIKTNLMRYTLDGLAQSIVPRTAYNQQTVNAEDMASVEVGANVRVKGPPGSEISPIATAFPGDQALAMLAYMDEVKASRTGVSKASQGLDPEALQGATAFATKVTVTAAEMRQEMIARFFAETLKRVFRGILKLAHQYQDKPKVVRLRNKFVTIDPRAWNVDMDATVNVAIGSNNREAKVVAYAQVAQKQEQILLQLGPDNPLCDISQLRNSYAKVLELIGDKDVTSFFKEIGPEEVAQMAEAASQKDDPMAAQGQAAVMLAQAEMAKAQADMMTAQTKPQTEMQKLAYEQDFKRDQLESDVILKAVDTALKYGINPDAMIQLTFAAMARQRQSQPMPVVPPALNIPSPGPPPGPPQGNGQMPPGMGMQ